MGDNKLLVLVTGATGQQGGAVTQALLQRGHSVRAMVRDTNSEKAVTLGQMSVELIVGDMEDTESIAVTYRAVSCTTSGISRMSRRVCSSGSHRPESRTCSVKWPGIRNGTWKLVPSMVSPSRKRATEPLADGARRSIRGSLMNDCSRRGRPTRSDATRGYETWKPWSLTPSTWPVQWHPVLGSTWTRRSMIMPTHAGSPLVRPCSSRSDSSFT